MPHLLPQGESARNKPRRAGYSLSVGGGAGSSQKGDLRAKMLDVFNGVVWIDDAQIVSGLIEKHYSDRPRLRIEVSGLGAQS